MSAQYRDGVLLVQPWHGDHAFTFAATDIPPAQLELDRCSFVSGVTRGRYKDDYGGSSKRHGAILSYSSRLSPNRMLFICADVRPQAGRLPAVPVAFLLI
ncbi:hypothetical protein GCM10017708_06020 [Arthrobacter citreus]